MASGNVLLDILGAAAVPRVPDYASQIQMPQQAPAQPAMSKGQLIAGILGDALAGFAGQPGRFAQMMERRREAQDEDVRWSNRQKLENDQWTQRQLWQQQHPDPAPIQRDVAAWQGMTDPQRAAYHDMHPEPDIVTTLPNGQLYAGPRSGLAAALTGGITPTAPPAAPVGKLTPITGGPTPQASGTFRR